jgi:hypothetical protein
MEHESLLTYPMAFIGQSESNIVTDEEFFYNENDRMSYFKSMEIAIHNLTLIDRLTKINSVRKG